MMMSAMSAPGSLDAGAKALAEGDWATARGIFEASVEAEASADALDGLGLAVWWAGDVRAGLAIRARAYAAFRKEGRLDRAARVALWLAQERHVSDPSDVVASGWLQRAEGLAGELDDPVVDGWLDVVRSDFEADPNAAAELAGRAVEIGRRNGDPDLEIVALSRLGTIEVGLGRVEEGTAHLDEAMTAATAGEGRDPRSIGEAVCSLMEVADMLGDSTRFATWAEEIDEYRSAYDYPGLGRYGSVSFHGAVASFCAACCGGLYVVNHRLDDAERELVAAIRTLEEQDLRSRCVHPVTQLAELRVAQGRVDEAQVLLQAYEDLPEAVRPLALLDLALGSPDTAAARLRARIEQLGDLDVLALPLWDVLVDAEIAREDLGAARAAAAEVERIAGVTKSPRHDALARFATGRVAAAGGADDAPDILRDAGKRLGDASMPLLAARARLLLAQTLVAGDRGVAIAEARGALAALERLGATSDADRAAAFLRDLGVTGRTGPKDIGRLTKREVEVLRLVAHGYSDREIAERLFISTKTVGHHVSNILSKLGVRGRTEAAAFAAIHLAPPEHASR
jgi:DNA-binding CsgD family transcriptional regulator